MAKPSSMATHPGWVNRNSGPNFTIRRKVVPQRPTPNVVCISKPLSFSNYCQIFRRNRPFLHPRYEHPKKLILDVKTPVLFFTVCGPKFTQVRYTFTGVIVVYNAVFWVTISCSVPEIIVIKSQCSQKSRQKIDVYGPSNFWEYLSLGGGAFVNISYSLTCVKFYWGSASHQWIY